MKEYRDITESPRRIFVIGDIHGCLTELQILVEFLEKGEEIDADDLLVFIGDYIDRGPNSSGVLDFLIEIQSRRPQSTIFLKGNHEDMFLSYLGFPGTGGLGYLLNGGMSCIESYGVSAGTPAEEVRNNIPQEHINFLQSLVRYAISEKFAFAHAGMNPLRDLRFQLDDDLYWIRDEFIANVHYFRKTVIFGHTPFEDVMFHLPYKIGIDTGLVYGNTLTCVELEHERTYQIDAGDDGVRIASFEEKGGMWPKHSWV